MFKISGFNDDDGLRKKEFYDGLWSFLESLVFLFFCNFLEVRPEVRLKNNYTKNNGMRGHWKTLSMDGSLFSEGTSSQN